MMTVASETAISVERVQETTLRLTLVWSLEFKN